jgi:hypothetical protein
MAAFMAYSGFKGLDVVGRQSIASFDEVLKTIPDKVTPIDGGWSLSAPDGMARFIWSEDYSQSPLHDLMLEVDAEPFLQAGLEPEKLPENYSFFEAGQAGGPGQAKLMVGRKLGGDKPAADGGSTALEVYEQIVDKYREAVNYHAVFDHYGLDLGEGNMFEWAKDMKTNGYDKTVQDKDIVFVLNPAPLIAAGVDPDKVEGWAYGEVPIEKDGRAEQVWKFLKVFDLKQ